MSYATGDSLKVRIRIAFGATIAADPATWAWTDVTSWWHTPDEVQIAWGRSSGAEQPETSTMSLTLKNSDGRFTANDPRSPYWPHMRKWTPISYDVDLGDGAGWRNRFSGFLRRLPLTWPGASSLMALAKIEAVGVLGRLGRGKPPARSAMRRTIPTIGALAYWPLEDGDNAEQVASAYPGHAPMAVTGPVSFASIESWNTSKGYTVTYGTSALADLSGGAALTAPVPADVTAATAAEWTVAVAADVEVPTVRDLILVEVQVTGGTFVAWRMVVTTTSHLLIVAVDGAGNTVTVGDIAGVNSGMFVHGFSVWKSGPTQIAAGYNWNSVLGWEGGGVATGTAVGGITQVAINPTRATFTVPIPAGHLAVWPQYAPAAAALDGANGLLARALYSFGINNPGTFEAATTGEPATQRLARLTAEDGVPLAVPAVDPVDEVMLGVQKPGTPLALYQECEAADGGLIYESGFGLGYLPRVSRYNAPVALTIDAAQGQLGMPFEPVDDDQTLRNRWTVERTDGSSAVAEDQQSIDLQGEIEGFATVNLAGDLALPDHASWRLRLSTVQEPRYPALSINLAVHPELAAAWTGCKPGSRVQVVNPPAQNVPGVVDQLVVGATETYAGRTSWKATLNTVPASPWVAATADGDERVPADGTVLTADITSAATTFQITSTALNGRWGTAADGAEFPMDVLVGGELVRLSAITGTGLTQTATVATGGRGLGGFARAWPAGTPVDVAYPAIVPL